MCVHVSVVVEVAKVKLNHSGSLKSAGFSCWDGPISHPNNMASAIGIRLLQQRVLSSKTARVELKSGSFAVGALSNLDNESAR